MTDGRIPVYLDAAAIPRQAGPIAWLVEDEAATDAAIHERYTLARLHPVGCACCAPRGAVAQALGRLFLRRARGEVAMFGAVGVQARGPAGLAAVAEAVTADVLARARFRLAGA
jgi:hypothetical protein